MNIPIQQKFERKPLLHQRNSAKQLYETFKETFKRLNGKEFIENYESKNFIYTLIYYFTKQSNFYKSPLLFNFLGTEARLEKGLIIVGGFGCGKSSILKTFQEMVKNDKVHNLKFITSIQAVNEYEATDQENLHDFNNRIEKGNLIIDDLLAEKTASRYGKKELFENVLFQRCENQKATTIITMNFDSELPNDMEFALEKLSRYGGRVFDRILGGFNFIQLDGKSFRN